METESKQIIEKKVYEDGKRDYATKGEALGVGIPALVLGGVAAASMLFGRGRGLNFGGNGMPENVAIATGGSCNGSQAAGVSAPTAFQAWRKECDDMVDLTNAMWRQKVDTLKEMYDHRNTDINEKFGLYKSQIDADFGLYKSQRDADDAITAKFNADVFGLYKSQRDNYDALKAELDEVKQSVAINAAIRPYQDKLIQCEIDKAFTAGINYTDRKTCRMISGEVVLPNTPTVTGYASYTPCFCPKVQAPAAPAAK